MTDIEAKLKFLASPAAYGNGDRKVECIETHMSWVFLVGQQVFELKKTVRFPFLDFSSVQAREFFCREEVRLNARLAMAHLLDENPRSPEKWPPLAERYKALAINSSDKAC